MLALGHSYNIKDLFISWPLKNIQWMPSKSKCIFKRDAIHSVFRNAIQLVLEDIINDNARFYLPIKNRDSYIYMDRIDGDNFKMARQNGAFQKIDFLTSNFSAYRLTFNRAKKDNTGRKINIYVSSLLKDKIIDFTNKGKQYG